MRRLGVHELEEVFHDVTPVPQNDGDDSVCAIDYPPTFEAAYGFMRAMWQTKELSERSFRLTELCLRLNPANYTVWHFRRQCLAALGIIQDAETIRMDLNLAASLGGENPKNYQIWYHRRALLDASPSIRDFAQGELDYIADVLDEDGKNYHAWSHRQWVVTTLNDDEIWEKELDFAKNLIDEDVRNNSAWNQRWFVVHRGNRAGLTPENARRECEFAIESGTMIDPFNESPWRYLVGLIKEQWRLDSKTPLLDEYVKRAVDLRDVVATAGKAADTCVSLTSARIDLLGMKGDASSLETAIALAKGLGEEYDKIRSKYWDLRVKEMEARRASL